MNKTQGTEKQYGDALADRAAALLEQANIDKRNGLPERLFLCISSLIPIANVDLFILDKSGRLLLSYRKDVFYGAGWHIPGGCLRFGETMLQRVHKTAQFELGADVAVCGGPLAVRDVIREPLTENAVPDARGHNLAVLYLCSLPSEAEANIETSSGGKIRWFARVPEDILPIHAVYDDLFIQYGLK